MWVEYPDDAELSQSRKRPGHSSPLTRDAENNLGHVTLSDVDDDEDDSLADPVYIYVADVDDADSDDEEVSELERLLGTLVVLGFIVAVEKAKPHVARWWSDRARPAIARARSRLGRFRRSGRRPATAASSALLGRTPRDSSQEMLSALDKYRSSMTSAEARDRFVAALVAREFSDAQLRILRQARIDDPAGQVELESAAEAVTPEQVAQALTLMLESNPTLVDQGALADLARLLHGPGVQGRHVPLPNDKVRQALKLTRGVQQ